ncbi:hypothetical protein NQ318_004507 [Aromia moschata]|uniref:Uncharacterized protein n=1 Tax=Aromia moschata TaxID=1265417 RepID=A0AAV8X8S4_9CUCU|nr:hypothetical protein NQ318_004507 [Aromia moschata]
MYLFTKDRRILQIRNILLRYICTCVYFVLINVNLVIRTYQVDLYVNVSKFRCFEKIGKGKLENVVVSQTKPILINRPSLNHIFLYLDGPIYISYYCLYDKRYLKNIQCPIKII